MIDLHMHSINSDGEFSTLELVEKIVNSGINIFSITDHDNINSCLEMERIKLSSNFLYVPGVEFSACCGRYQCHILGYDVDYRNVRLVRECSEIKKRKLEKIKLVLKYLRDVHMIDITQDEEFSIINKKGTIGRMDICKLLIKKGYGTRSEIYDKYLTIPNMKSHRSDAGIITDIIKQSNGVSILAHPKEIEDDYKVNIEDIIENFLKIGIDGIEVYNSIHTLKDVRRYLLLAKKYNLLTTGGSDFHGKLKPERCLGLTTTEHIPIELNQLNFHSKGIILKK